MLIRNLMLPDMFDGLNLIHLTRLPQMHLRSDTVNNFKLVRLICGIHITRFGITVRT